MSDNKTESPILALQHQRLLLDMEYNADKEAFRKQTEAMGMQRLVKRGDAWWPLRVGKSYYNSLNQLVVEVHRTADDEIEHNFEFGRSVAFFRKETDGNTLKYFSFTGTVSYVDGDRMVVAVPDGAASTLAGSEGVGVQLSFDETSYRLMFEALERTMRGKGRLGYLRDLFYTSQKAERFTFQPMRFPYLNATQEEAVNEVLRAKDVAVVHGPPGTGKTTTLVEAIYETLRRENQVLVCAQSNMAVDWISEKLVDRGINVLRIGNPSRVNDKMLSFTYERRFEAHPDYPQLWSIRKTMRELRAHRKRGDEKFHQKMDSLRSRATELEVRINAELFGEARVIACTLVGSANRLLDGMKFGTLFIDEAAQALEAACWIAIRRAGKVVLAGDHCQLPPTVKCYEAMRGGLDKTLMQRIVANKPDVVTLLKIQYRMNEQIMRFSSDWFYHGMVEAAPEVKHRSILDLDRPMEWVDTSGGNCEFGITNYELAIRSENGLTPDSSPSSTKLSTGKGEGGSNNPSSLIPNPSSLISHPSSLISHPSSELESFRETFVGETFGRINKAEAHLTIQMLCNYFERIGKHRLLDERIDVGVISPYRAQVQYLRRLIMKNEYLKPFRRSISVNTVDGFQGQERDIIVVSLVRSNDEGQIGFLRDLRRMNVAITRARMKLIIIGDQSTMTSHPFYRKLYQLCCAIE